MEETYGERSEGLPSEFHAEPKPVEPATSGYEYLGV